MKRIHYNMQSMRNKLKETRSSIPMITIYNGNLHWHHRSHYLPGVTFDKPIKMLSLGQFTIMLREPGSELVLTCCCLRVYPTARNLGDTSDHLSLNSTDELSIETLWWFFCPRTFHVRVLLRSISVKPTTEIRLINSDWGTSTDTGTISSTFREIMS